MNTMLLNYTTQNILLGTMFMGIAAGTLGCFAFLRRQSLLADAISHASLPGIAIMFLCTYSKSTMLLLCGGAIAGAVGTVVVGAITAYTPLKKDAALGIVLSVFFGLGLVLMTIIQKRTTADQAVLSKFLFGNASTLLLSEVISIGVVSFLLLMMLFLFWKEFVLITFDELYAYALQYPVHYLNFMLTGLLVLAIVIGLQTVGVVLSSTMFIAPAAAARQWTHKLGTMVILAGCFGGIACMIGTLISSQVPQLPTGPTIVVVISGITLISLFFGTARGILWQVLNTFRHP